MTRLSSLHACAGDQLDDSPRTVQEPVEPLDPAAALQILQAAPVETAALLEVLAAIAHEITQPLAGILANVGACLRMLAADPPDVEGARETARRTLRDGNRAADVITRLRALFSAEDIDRSRDSEMRALRSCYASLTPREREVMAGVVSGRLNKQVGGALGISEITVKAHRGQVMRKMKADSLPELVTMAARLGVARIPSLGMGKSAPTPPRPALARIPPR
jgi:DNA-binding CsgD family transcriptional regulator